MAEMSIVSFAKTLGAVHRSEGLAAYREHPGLQQRLVGTSTRVHLTFSLHFAWAIEGAVGSDFKIDASYLSPHVSIAKSIESASEVYSVPLIIAESVRELCNPKIAGKCRLIDQVKIAGSPTAMQIFSVDLDYLALEVERHAPLQINWSNPKKRFEARKKLASEKEEKLRREFDPSLVFDKDPMITLMRKRYTVEFLHFFNMGFQNYAQGEWSVANVMLKRTSTNYGFEDGPSLALLRYMDTHSISSEQCEAPSDWRGVRLLSTAEVAENHS